MRPNSDPGLTSRPAALGTWEHRPPARAQRPPINGIWELRPSLNGIWELRPIYGVLGAQCVVTMTVLVDSPRSPKFLVAELLSGLCGIVSCRIV